jgi:integrase
MKEKKFAHAYERGGIVYVSGSVNGVRHRLSTNKQASSANLKWVDANWRVCIESILSGVEENKGGKQPEGITLGEYGLKSLEANAGNRRELTNKEYLAIFEKRIVPFFGKKPLNAILSTDVKQWQSKLKEEGLSGARIHNIRVVFSGILSDALNDRLINESPFGFVKTISKDDVDINPFALEEVRLLIASADGFFKNMLNVAFFTGMRTGELLGLRWEDVDFRTGTIRVRRAVRSGIKGDVKTKSSKRDIMMLSPVKEALKAQYLETGLKNEEVFISSRGDGFGHSSSITDRYWHRLCQKCGLEKRDFYHTRHTFATLMVSNGEDILWVSNMMGHKDISMVMKKYAKYRVDNRIKRATFLDETTAESVSKVNVS